MITAIVLALMPQVFLQAAVQRVELGDLRGAQEAADQATDPVERAQAIVYVRQHAGDLEGALREAVRGSNAAPTDAWLAERALAMSLSLSRARPAETALARLDTILIDPTVRNRDAYLSAVNRARSEVDVLSTAARARNTAESRAHFVVILAGLGSVATLVFVARKV